jgi:hypothetical protein
VVDFPKPGSPSTMINFVFKKIYTFLRQNGLIIL